ncbi:MAG: FAD:protein FMN transferase [Bacteroidales bacterium]|nr:FAD:protein FMN transferase [Bacteroidales bacterium]
MTHQARHLYAALSLALGTLLFAGCRTAGDTPIKLVGEAQGTFYNITYYDSEQRDLQGAIDSLLADFDLTASLWVDSSLLCRVNRNEDSVLNALFSDLLEKSIMMNQFTEGCFDCRVGQLVRSYGFGNGPRTALSDNQIDSLLAICQQPVAMVETQEGIVLRKANPATALDFNAIAQGYAVDMVCRFLEQRGISNYLVDIGGEVVAHGCKADSSLWLVGIERPADNRYSAPEIEKAITLKDCSVVTSGSYRKYYQKDGLRYSHTIDPSTGRPVQHTLLSVSVVDTAAWRADALATAFMVMGLERAQTFIAAHPYDSGTQAVFFIYSTPDGYATYATPAFEKLILQDEKQ